MNRFSTIAFATALMASSFGCNKANDKDKKDPVAETDNNAEVKTDAPKPGDIPAPADVAAAPVDAKKTENGVMYKVLTPAATPGDKPTVNDTVEVHYTGWTTDGKMFDSSVKRGKTASFGLTRVIPGWTEGLQVMSVGEKTRFWIPEELAYKGRKGSPAGMLVFDVELIGVKRAPKVPEDVAAAPADAKKTKLGVSYKFLTTGTSKAADKPNAWDQVQVTYSGWTTDGKMFDSTATRDRPADIPLSRTSEGWQEIVPLMGPGDKVRAWIPEAQAKGRPGGPPGTLVFDIELHEVKRMPEPPKAPKNVAAPPKNAKKSPKGVSYLVLTKGKKGGKKPKATDTVEVHYTGWTTNGKMFDSSVTRGQTAQFPLNRVIAGWTDGLQVMTVGEKTRFWIPEALAYQGQPGKPAGMLVFDVELISIKDAPKPVAKPVSPHGAGKPHAAGKKADSKKPEAKKIQADQTK